MLPTTLVSRWSAYQPDFSKLNKLTSDASESNLPRLKGVTVEKAKAYGFANHAPEGNPAHGTILHFGQFHPLSIPTPCIDDHDLVVKSQAKILEGLLRFKPKHLFMESMYPELIEEIAQVGPNSATLDRIKKGFAKYQIGSLEPYQSSLIYKFGAHRIYCCLIAEVKLHSTTTKLARNEFDKYVDDNIHRFVSGELTQEDYRRLNPDRECQAANALEKFLKENPGEEVAFVFGLNHDFTYQWAQLGISPQVFYINTAN